MSFFKSKEDHETISVHIEIVSFTVGDYIIERANQGYEKLEIIGSMYNYYTKEERHAGKGGMSVVIHVPYSNGYKSDGVSFGFLSFSLDGETEKFTYCDLSLSCSAIADLAAELRLRNPKELRLYCRRAKGAQRDFDVYKVIIGQDNYRNLT